MGDANVARGQLSQDVGGNFAFEDGFAEERGDFLLVLVKVRVLFPGIDSGQESDVRVDNVRLFGRPLPGHDLLETKGQIVPGSGELLHRTDGSNEKVSGAQGVLGVDGHYGELIHGRTRGGDEFPGKLVVAESRTPILLTILAGGLQFPISR